MLWYAYVNNNPVNFIDPLGLFEFACLPENYPGGFYDADWEDHDRYLAGERRNPAPPDIVINPPATDFNNEIYEQAWNQIVYGNYSEDVTIIGMMGQVAVGLTGLDFAADIRDVWYDLTHWEWSWGHAGQLALDGIGLVPLIGAVKYGDEVGTLLRNGNRLSNVVESSTDVGNAVLRSRDEIVEMAQRLIQQADNSDDIVFRVIRADETPSVGLIAKNPNATYTIEGHILNGSREGFQSQFISTTRDIDVAIRWASNTGNRIVAIDLSIVNGSIFDLSTLDRAMNFLRGNTARNFAASSAEVLIQGNVPARAITELF